MRNLISFTVTSLVVACLALLPESGVRAEVYSAGVGDDPGSVRGDDPRDGGGDDGGGGRVVGGDGEGRGAAPEVTAIDTFAVVGTTPGERYRLEFTFDQNVTGFTLGDITVTNALTVSDVTGLGTSWSLEVKPVPENDFEGTMTVTVEAGAVQNTMNETNAEFSRSFEIDNKEPELETAEADGTTITLTFHEDVDDAGQPAVQDFDVIVTLAGQTTSQAPFDPDGATAQINVVTLTLPDDKAIQPGDVVELTYNGNTKPLADRRGNPVALSTEPVENVNTLSPPDPVTDLKATGISTTEIKLTWTAPDEGSSAINGYRIEVRNNASSAWDELEANTDDADTEYTHEGLTPNTTRHYQIFAINSQGRSSGSNTATGTTKREGDVPDPPTELTATARGGHGDPAELGRAHRYTEPARSPATRSRFPPMAAATSTSHASVGGSTTTYRHSGLRPNTTRHYQGPGRQRHGR